MLRRLFVAVAAVGTVLVSGGAVSQPTASRAPAGVLPASQGAPVFRAGIVPAPAGSAAHYELRHRRASALFTGTGMTMRLPSHVQPVRELGWSVAGARVVKPQAEKPREAKFHRLVGARKSWQPELPTYEGLRYPGVRPGVDLWFEEQAEGVKYGFRAERGADLKRVELEYAGAREVRVVEAGRALEVDLGEDVLREEGLRCEQQGADGTMREVGCRFTGARPVGRERWVYAIEVDVADPELPVVVDPLVLWNTYLGGPGGNDALQAIQQDSATGDLFVVGTVESAPVSSNGEGTLLGARGAGDVFVARFKRDGALVWWTMFGGDELDAGVALVIGSAGELYIAGSTNSAYFEWAAPDGRTGSSWGLGSTDGFVARLDSTGKTLEWFMRVGGSSTDGIFAMVQGPGGRLFVGGTTLSNNIPGNTVPVDGLEGFVSRIDPTPALPQLEWTRLIRDTGNQKVLALAYADDGSLYATGDSLFGDRVPLDAFVSRLPGADSSEPGTPSTHIFGGNGNDMGAAVSAPPAGVPGDVVVWGTTYSNRFENVEVQGGSDMFAAVFEENAGAWALRKSVLFGGEGVDVLSVMTTDSSGRIFLGGATGSRQLPFDGGFDTTLEDNGLGDGFVARVRLVPEFAIEWGSFVGGSGAEGILALRVDSQNPERLYFGGRTDSDDLTYSNGGFDTSPNDTGTNWNMFLMAADLVASPPGPPPVPVTVPVSPLGWSCGASVTSGGPGALALGVLAGLVLLVSRRRPRA
ncbi:DUF7948 domain-containing protein [Archangium violaceum]|uniref:DUF7948 domain-containing protein n=1 Tax=Archangium violaceum TaxID=83451 RepID=UPI0036D87D00